MKTKLKLNEGDIVEVYNFTPSGTEFMEGKAKLIEYHRSDFGGEYWDVEFLTEPGETFTRWIDRPA